MRTFCSETSANRHNSGKFEILIALQNDLRWLFLHSWFSKFPWGRSPGPPYKRYTGKFGISFFYPTSVPRRHPHLPLISSLIQKRYLLGIWYDNLWFCDPWFYQQNYLSRPLFLLYCFCLDMVTVMQRFCWEWWILLIKQIFYWLVTTDLLDPPSRPSDI